MTSGLMNMSDEERQIAIGARIRALRQAKGFTQEDIAFPAGIDRAGLTKLENGMKVPSVLQLIRIAVVLEVEVGDLFPPMK
jgi:transcriptional regulator with XRE-family HTH domain